MLDRGFEFYERQLARNGDVPPGLFFGVHALPQPTESARLALARMSSNAARAIAAGLGSARAQGAAAAVRVRPRHRAGWRSRRPTTTRPSCRAAAARYPYGGIDLARLYDGRQEVAAGIGGRPPASFGLLVRDISGRRVFATQLPDRGRLRLTQAPHGVGARASAWTGRAYAGPFQDLRAAGIARGGGWTGADEPPLHARSSCRRPGRCGGRAPRGRASVDVLFPSWGARRRGDRRDARRLDARGSGTCGSRCARVAQLRVREPARRATSCSRGRARAARRCTCCTRAAQSSAPLAGPTLAVQLAAREPRRGRRASAPATRPWNANGPRRPRPAWRSDR